MNGRFVLLIVLSVFSLASFAKEYRVLTGLKAPMSDYSEAIQTEMFQRIGHSVIQKLIPAGRAIQLTSEGVFDGSCCRIKKITRIFPSTVIVPERFFSLNFTAFTNKEGIDIQKWADIKPYNVASVEGFKLIQMKVNKVNPKSFRKLPDSTAMFKMLDSGRIDVALLNYVDAKLLIKKLKLKNIKATLPVLSSVPVYLTLHKSNSDLVTPLDKALKAMKKDGTFDAITKKYFSFF